MADIEKSQTPEVTQLTTADQIHVDVAGRVFEQSLQYDPAQLERDAVKVRRKLDFVVLPMVWIWLNPTITAWSIADMRNTIDDDDLHAFFS